MKSLLNKILIAAVLLAAGVVIYLNRQKAPPFPVPVPVVQAMPAPAAEAPAPDTNLPPVPVADPVVSAAVATNVLPSTNLIPALVQAAAATEFSKTIDALLSPGIPAMEKHALFLKLLKDGQMDQAIAELKQRAADEPGNPEIPTTLGEAQINKLRALHEAGGDPNEIGILAMQADQSFNTALKIDPANWEAQFVKAASLSRWPADATRDADVVQRLSSLIDQQDKMSVQPQFAQSYVVLGEQYLKIGKPDYAVQTWKLGAQKFPNDPALQRKLASQ